MPTMHAEFLARMKALISGDLPLPMVIADETAPSRVEFYEIGEILCRLRRGEAPMMNARQAGLLHDAIDHGVDLVMAGVTPETEEDWVAAVFMETAFALGDAGELAFRLSAIRDDMVVD